MGTPLRLAPLSVTRWIGRLRWLRWLDALIAGAGVWLIGAGALGLAPTGASLWLASVVLAAGVALRPLRVRWRPLTGLVGLSVSRGLRAGDHAWYVRARDADLVLVTACHGWRVVIARPDFGGDEGFSVRRTRVVLLPADAPSA